MVGAAPLAAEPCVGLGCSPGGFGLFTAGADYLLGFFPRGKPAVVLGAGTTAAGQLVG